MNWEDTFRKWGGPPGKIEKEKMENTEAAIKKAISVDSVISKMNISVFAQGSYKSRTTVQQDSDVDVCVRLNSTFFPRYPAGKTKEDFGNFDGSITFSKYKSLIENALTNYFGVENVVRGNKAFDIHANTYRVDADVLPALAYRYYYNKAEDSSDYVKPIGVAFLTDNDVKIKNWPKQAYDNGVLKQGATGERYKKMVRILKKLRNKMQDEGIFKANNIPSFLIESMIWNVPNSRFNNERYCTDVKKVVANCFNSTVSDEKSENLKEVNNIKYLFHSSQPWTRSQAHDFFEAAWEYIGFE